MDTLSNATTPCSRGTRTGLAMLLTVVLLAGLIVPWMAPQAASAAPSVPSYVTAKVTHLYDGTGHDTIAEDGTTAQTFITTDNGYAVGDDTPDDGVVSTGDKVGLRLTLAFTAAGKRTIRVAWDVSQAPYLAGEPIGCVSGTQVTGKTQEDGSCVYTVPAGAVETIEQTIALSALDSKGIVQAGQVARLTVARDQDNGAIASYPTREYTVVSSPAADLVAVNHDLLTQEERKTSWSSSNPMRGYVDVQARAVRYPGYSTSHGASTAGAWSAWIDVSEWPEHASFTVDGTPVTVQDGRFRVTNHNGDARIEWSVPVEDMAWLKCSSIAMYAIGVIADDTSFSVDGGVPNLGVGGEPGSRLTRDQSTQDSTLGTDRGYPYANNSWTRAIIERGACPCDAQTGVCINKQVEQPYTSGATMYEKASLLFDEADGRRLAADLGNVHRAAGTGSELDSIVTVRTAVDVTGIVTIIDTFDPILMDALNVQWVEADGTRLDSTMYDVNYSPDGSTWSEQPASDSSRIRIRFDYEQAGSPQLIRACVRTILTGEGVEAFENVEVRDTYTVRMQTSAGKVYEPRVTTWVWATAPGDPAVDLGFDAVVTDGDGNPLTDAQPGATTTFTLTPVVKNILAQGTPMNPTISVNLPNGLIRPVNLSDEWVMSADGNTLTFTMPTPITPYVEDDATVTLPALSWSATVSNLAQGTLVTGARARVDTQEHKGVPATQITSNLVSNTLAVTDLAVNGSSLTALDGPADIGDPLSWRSNTVAQGDTRTGVMRQVILMPSNQDAILTGEHGTGLHGTWNEYDRGSSAYTGTWRMDREPVVDTANSTATTLKYSTTLAWTDNPDDYEWKLWDDLTDEERGSITAILTESTVDTTIDTPTAAADLTITLTPTDNQTEDRYVMWPGVTHYTDGHINGEQPWADVLNVVSGTVSGTLWWDSDANTIMAANESRVPDITVTLLDADGNTVATTTTGNDGYYEFTGLHAGEYKVTVTRGGTNGVPLNTTSYFNTTMDVTVTSSWPARTGNKASDTSGRIRLDKGMSVEHVDFGYYSPDPKATVDKTVTRLNCDDTACKVGWDVTITNLSGSTTRMANSGPTIDTHYEHTLMVDYEGRLWTWGFNRYDMNGVYNADASTMSKPGLLGHGLKGSLSPVDVTPENVRFTSVAVGETHSAAIDTNGDLWTWGFNNYGQLANGSKTPAMYPTKVTNGMNLTYAAATSQTTWVLDSDGQLWVTGTPDTGVDGNGNATDNTTTLVFRRAANGYRFSKIDIRNYTMIALDLEGRLYMWGRNYNYLLNAAGNDHQRAPVNILPDLRFTDVAIGSYAAGAVDEQGRLWLWGDNRNGLMGTGVASATGYLPHMPDPSRRYTSVSIGYLNGAAVTVDGQLIQWGSQKFNIFNNDPVNENLYKPFTVIDIGGHKVNYAITNNGERFAITTDGRINGAGFNDHGEVGVGNLYVQRPSTFLNVPAGKLRAPTGESVEQGTGVSLDGVIYDRLDANVTDVTATIGKQQHRAPQEPVFVDVAAGQSNSIGLDSDGRVWTWGLNQYGQANPNTIGSSQRTPFLREDLPGRFQAVSTGRSMYMALDVEGRIWTWGNNYQGMLGHGSTEEYVTEPKIIASGTRFRQIVASYTNGYAIDTENNLWAWGNMNLIPDETITSHQSTPVMIKGRKYKALATGAVWNTQMAAIDMDGQLWHWGLEDWYLGTSLGGRVDVFYRTPEKMLEGHRVRMAAVGWRHILALTDNGQLFAWGANYAKNVDYDSNEPFILTPVETSVGEPIQQISTADGANYAIGQSGALYAWGRSYNGELGNGSNANASRISKVADHVKQVAAGKYYVLIVDTNGHVRATGQGEDYKLGNNTNYDRNKFSTLTAMDNGVYEDKDAVPVEPVAIREEHGTTVRSYQLPWNVNAGATITLHVSGRVPRTSADQIIANQAWFTNALTPYSGTPHAITAGVSEPTAPDTTNWDDSSRDITGNVSCRTGSDYATPDMEHWFSTSAEDLCDQVGIRVPALKKGTVIGSISGMLWRDENADGVRGANEQERLGGRQVNLVDGDGTILMSTRTALDGTYSFAGLPLGTYWVQFERPLRAKFTQHDANDQNPTIDTSSTDSDAHTGDEWYGYATATVTLTESAPHKGNVDAGVLIEPSYLSVMPNTGQTMLLLMILIVMLLLARGRRIMRRQLTLA